MSLTVANGLKNQGFRHTEATANFVQLVDVFFDCLNVSQTYQGQKSRKEALYPYTSPDDWRFSVSSKLFAKV